MKNNSTLAAIESTIILIGPMSAGKSTIGELLANKLDLPQYSIDDYRWEYYKEIGYDEAEASKIVNSSQGMLGLLAYWKPFEAHAVERFLADHHHCVIDFGAGHSVYEDEALFTQVQRVLAPYPNIILLLPSPDLDESVEILNARFSQLLLEEVGEIDEALMGVNEQFVKHPSNHQLARMIVYTNDKTAKETCAEILRRLGKPGAA
jgi:shikimate kinase